MKPVFLFNIITSRCLSCALVLLLCGSWVPARADDIDSTAREFDHYFHQLMEQQHIPGGAYVIVDGNRVVAMGTYGVRVKGKRDKVDRNTVFRLASVSKTFAASMAAVLEHEGKFSWDDQVVSFVPEFRFKSASLTRQLHVQHLLSHSSGLTPNAYDNYLEHNQPLSKIVPMFAKIDPRCTPGECYGYQNVLFSLIGDVIREATGISYGRLLEKRIFTPLHMAHASLGWKSFMISDNRAAPHVQTGSGWAPVEVRKEYYLAAPAAGVNASISDMAQWLKAQMGYYPKVLSPEVIQDITTERVETRRHMRHRIWRDYLTHAGYGLGWRLYTIGDDRIIYHGGWVAGFRAAVAYSEKMKIGIAVLMNAESRVISDLTANFVVDITGNGTLATAMASSD